MIIHGINDDILIPHLSYSSVYQDETKNESSTKRLCFWGETTPPPPKLTNIGAHLSINIGN